MESRSATVRITQSELYSGSDTERTPGSGTLPHEISIGRFTRMEKTFQIEISSCFLLFQVSLDKQAGICLVPVSEEGS